MRNTKLDKEQGTDFLIGVTRFDATLNFFSKNNMLIWHDTGIRACNCNNFLLGIRHGNNHKGYTNFEKPVVVLGIDIPPWEYNKNWATITDNMAHGIEKILMDAGDLMAQYTELDPEERKMLFECDIKINEAYREPKGIKTEYAKANRIFIPNLPPITDEPENENEPSF